MSKTKLLCVGVLGVSPKKQARLKQEFHGLLRLTFWYEGSTASLQSLGRSSTIVLVGRLSGHNACEVLDTVRANWKYIPSYTQLRETLATLAGV